MVFVKQSCEAASASPVTKRGVVDGDVRLHELIRGAIRRDAGAVDVLRGVAGRKLSLTPINAVNGLLILNQVINDNIAIVVFIRTP